MLSYKRSFREKKRVTGIGLCYEVNFVINHLVHVRRSALCYVDMQASKRPTLIMHTGVDCVAPKDDTAPFGHVDVHSWF